MKHVNKVYILLIVAFTMLLSINSVSYAVGIVEGDGSKKTPYVLQFDNIGDTVDIPYEGKADFWFEVTGNAAKGTYRVDFQKEFKTVSITLEANDNKMWYFQEHSTDAYYAQAGVQAMPDGSVIEPEENLRTFTITTVEEVDESKRKNGINHRMSSFFWSYASWGSGKNWGEYELRNTHVPGDDKTVHHPNYFIFAPWGTVKELYEEQAKRVTTGHEKFKYIKYGGDNNAEYILDPRYQVGFDILAAKSTYNPTRTIIFGKYQNPTADYVDSDADVNYIENYALKIKYHFKTTEDEVDERAGIIETAITYILLGIGMLLIVTIKVFLGSGLTMDAVIFNRYDMTVIDFRGRVGFFANENVRNIINVMYDGFEKLAIIANLIILLYLGIQIILAVGTDKQSKYFKHLQNWIVGLIILFLAPQFFPFLTDISNAIVGYIGSEVTPYVTQYNVAAILDDESILGENADTAYIKKRAEEGISKKNKELEEKEKELNRLETEANERYKSIIEYDQFMKNITESVIGFINSMSEEEKNEFRKKRDFLGTINTVTSYLNENRDTWNYQNEIEYAEIVSQFNENWKDKINEPYKPNHNSVDCVIAAGPQGCSSLCKETTKYPVAEANLFFKEYKAIQLECGQIEADIATLNTYLNTKDLMTEMRIKAGVTGRVTYVLIWYILVFQLISVLGMYFKRLIMLSILIMIFPIVMITYAIDKISDGKAQTLETWFKEFSVNILVQVAHAVIYVTLIKTGLAIFEANPKNWLIYIIAVTSLFPMERLLRGIFGMNGGTIGQLKASVAAGAALAWKAAKTGGKGIRSANNFRKDAKALGVGGAVKKRADAAKEKRKERKEKEKEEQDKKYAAEDKKAKKIQATADRKKRIRDSKIQLRREKMQGASGVKKAYYKTLNAASMVRNGMYHAGNVKRKIKGLGRTKAARFAGRALKKVGGGYAKANIMGAKYLSGALGAIEASGKGAGIIKSGAAGLTATKGFNGIMGDDKKKQQAQQAKKAPTQPQTVKPMKAKNGKGVAANGKATMTPKQRAAQAKTNRKNTKAQKHMIKNVKKINRQINVTHVKNDNSQADNNSQSTNS